MILPVSTHETALQARRPIRTFSLLPYTYDFDDDIQSTVVTMPRKYYVEDKEHERSLTCALTEDYASVYWH
jgi:hypothetical protein